MGSLLRRKRFVEKKKSICECRIFCLVAGLASCKEARLYDNFSLSIFAKNTNARRSRVSARSSINKNRENTPLGPRRLTEKHANTKPGAQVCQFEVRDLLSIVIDNSYGT